MQIQFFSFRLLGVFNKMAQCLLFTHSLYVRPSASIYPQVANRRFTWRQTCALAGRLFDKALSNSGVE
jgi:hypothetical protein